MQDDATRPARPPEASVEYLEAQYNNRTRVPGHPAIIAGWQRDAAAYREAAAGRHTRIAYADGARAHADDLQHLAAAFDTLYADMTPEQKAAADRTFHDFQGRRRARPHS